MAGSYRCVAAAVWASNTMLRDAHMMDRELYIYNFTTDTYNYVELDRQPKSSQYKHLLCVRKLHEQIHSAIVCITAEFGVHWVQIA